MPIVNTTSNTLRRIASHEIKINGLAGAILWISLFGFLLYVVGFATEGWLTVNLPVNILTHNDTTKLVRVGLWQSCYCGQEIHDYIEKEAWFQGSRALVIIGLFGFILTCSFSILYMFVHKLSKDRVLQGLIIAAFISCVFILVGVIVFGTRSMTYAKTRSLSVSHSFSLIFVVIGGFMSLIVAVLSLVQNIRARRKGGS